MADQFDFGLSLRSEYGSANRNYPLWSNEHLRAVSHVNDSPGEHRSRRLIMRPSQMDGSIVAALGDLRRSQSPRRARASALGQDRPCTLSGGGPSRSPLAMI